MKLLTEIKNHEIDHEIKLREDMINDILNRVLPKLYGEVRVLEEGF